MEEWRQPKYSCSMCVSVVLLNKIIRNKQHLLISLVVGYTVGNVKCSKEMVLREKPNLAGSER